MDLFHVQRFYGEDDEAGKGDNVALEMERLENLRDKIKRKRKASLGAIPKTSIVEKGKGVTNVAADDDTSSILRKEAAGKKKYTHIEHKDDVVKHKRKKKDGDSFGNIVPDIRKTESTEGLDKQRKRPSNSEKECGKKRKKKSEQDDERSTSSISSEKKAKNKDESDKDGVRVGDLEKGFEDDADTKKSDNSYKASDGETDSTLHQLDQSLNNSGSKKVKDSETEIKAKGQTDNYFKVLGSFDKKKEKKIVKRLLPKWIAEAKYIASDIDAGKVPLKEANFLEEFSINNLEEQNIEYLFPVQSCVIPLILSQNSRDTVYQKAGLLPSDICVSAPTGSGKTLAYVLPIVQILKKCEWRRLQAIVILPSRDLALQVKNVIGAYVNGTHVKVGLASGVKSFHDEQQQLISKGHHGFFSNVDILVCTPGRLVDHITSTDGFSLEYLRFLVIDEADRLLSQSYHNWLEKIFDAVYKPSIWNTTHNRVMSPLRSGSFYTTPSMVNKVQLPLQKLLFSATMTHNPEKLAPLKLYKPVLFTAVGRLEGKEESSDSRDNTNIERYMLPENLEQKIAVCKQSEKPLVVIYLIKMLEYKRILCFTGSIESTHRLALLVGECGIRTAEFSSTLNQTQRKGILRDFKNGKIDLLICSDSMARGMDIENVDFVVSYDPAANMKTYVHRVGRTARAGNKGTAMTLLSPKEVYHFKKMLLDHGNGRGIQKVNISYKKLEPLIGEYESALNSLKDSVKNENKSNL